MMPRLARGVSNVLSGWALLATNVAVGYFTTPLLLRALGVGGFGAWASLASVTFFLGLIELGLGAAGTRFLAASRSGGEAITATLSIWSVRLSAVAAAAGIIVAALMPHVLHDSAVSRGEATLTAALLGLSVAVGILFSGPLARLQAEQRWTVRNMILVVRQALWLGFTVLATRLGVGVVNLAAFVLALSLLQLGLLVVASRWSWSLSAGPRATVSGLVAYGRDRTLVGVVDLWVQQGPTILAASLLGPVAAAVTAVAMKIQDLIRQAVQAVSQLYLPRAARLAGARDHDIAQELKVATVGMAGLLAAPLAALSTSGSRFLRIWVGERFEVELGLLMPVILVPLWVGLVQQFQIEAFYGKGDARLRLIMQGAGAGLFTLIAWVAAPRLGVGGILIAQACGVLLADGILLPLMAKSHLGVRLRRHVWRALLVSVVSAASGGLIAWRGAAFTNTFPAYAAVVGLATIVGISAGWLVAPPEVRVLVKRVWSPNG
jgi:O-antigen/teichoic acid export membrane protein